MISENEIQTKELDPHQNLRKEPRYALRNKDCDFKFSTYFEQSHGKRIYAVEFCNQMKNDGPIIFATCGGNVVTIYECENNGKIKLFGCYADPNDSELYFACCWSFDTNTANPIIAVAGLNKIIRLIYPTTTSLNKHFIGHGGPINDLKIHPKNPIILLSASNDYSIRLWNIENGVCIAIFGGVGGHMSQVLSADFDAIGSRIASCGMDNSVKIWNLNKSPIQETFRASLTFDQNGYCFKTFVNHFPDHKIKNIYNEYVDCVKWMGNLIFSKSNEKAIVCSKLGPLGENTSTVSSFSVIRRFEHTGGAYFNVRFSMDASKNYMALGNHKGTVFVWQINGGEPTNVIRLKHRSCTAMVRATAFSRDAKILIAVCDDGTVWKWDEDDRI